GPVPVILEAQEPFGAWVKHGSGYSPKYRATVWSLLILAELGADPDDPGIRKGCEYLLDHSLASNGAFSAYQNSVPSGAFLCLNGNLLFALQRLGLGTDPRVQAVTLWMAGAIVGQQPNQYYALGTAGPDFACGVNLGQPCGWGANKAIRGLLEVPKEARTPLIDRALDAGARFLLSRDPAVADYPYTERVNSTWFKLGFPLSYWSDVLETISNLVNLGYGEDLRLKTALEWIVDKQDDNGRWKLENSLNGKMWTNIEAKGKPSKWITLRALRVLKEAGLYVPSG
ncbi:MAG: hypothetical protein WBD56_18055, partial [Anaerolineales bacterium]